MKLTLTHDEAIAEIKRYFSSSLGSDLEVEIIGSARTTIGSIITRVDNAYEDAAHNKIARIKLFRELCGKDVNGSYIGLGHAKNIIENWQQWKYQALASNNFPPSGGYNWKPIWA